MSSLSSAKIDKYEFGEEISPPDQRRLIQLAKFAYYPLEKALKKKKQTIEDQGKKQIKATEYHGKHLVESNKLVKRILILTKIA